METGSCIMFRSAQLFVVHAWNIHGRTEGVTGINSRVFVLRYGAGNGRGEGVWTVGG